MNIIINIGFVFSTTYLYFKIKKLTNKFHKINNKMKELNNKFDELNNKFDEMKKIKINEWAIKSIPFELENLENMKLLDEWDLLNSSSSIWLWFDKIANE